MTGAHQGSSCAGVILAAGRGERYEGDTPKLLAPFRGQPLLEWAIGAVLAAGLDETVVVVGARAGEISAGLPTGVTVLHNDCPSRGMATSLQVALDHARGAGHSAVVVGMADQPFVITEAWRRVAAHVADPIAVATYAGDRRNPVRLDRSVWSLVPSEGDEGMRGVMRLRPELVGEVPCPGHGADIDTLEDLNRWS